MSTPTPAERLQAAATLLRGRLADPQLTAGPWLSLDHGDRLLHNQPGDEDQAPVYVVNEPMSNGANADYIAAMHPGVGAALVTVLDQAAANYQPGVLGNGLVVCPDCCEEAPCSHIKPALALADAILAGGEQ
ncbi:hypothetical protein ACWERV_17150 [Streptomyces sp. NPDC004031]